MNGIRIALHDHATGEPLGRWRTEMMDYLPRLGEEVSIWGGGRIYIVRRVVHYPFQRIVRIYGELRKD